MVKAADAEMRIGDEVWVSVEEKHLMIFETATGNRIRPGDIESYNALLAEARC